MAEAKTAAELVSEAKASIENLGPEDVAKEMESGEVLVVDIREASEREGGRIPGSIHAPRGMLEFYADPSSPYHLEDFDPNKRVILHCAAGGRSSLGVKALEQLGYTNIAHLDGGFEAWKEAGNPVE